MIGATQQSVSIESQACGTTSCVLTQFPTAAGELKRLDLATGAVTTVDPGQGGIVVGGHGGETYIYLNAAGNT